MNSEITNSKVVCKYCGKELPTQNFAPFGFKPMLVTLPCDCEKYKQAIEQEEKEAEMRERRDALADVWFRSDVPERFRDVKADFNKAKSLFDGNWLYIYGENGRGKTYAACQTAKAYLIHNTKRDIIPTSKGDRKGPMKCRVSFHFTEAQGLLSDITSSWSRWDMNEAEVVARWIGVDLLILDDLGKGVPSEWAAEKLFEIVNKRWSNKKPTIITSQYSIAELSDRYRKAGDETLSAMISRLKGECDEIPLMGEDMRLSQVV